MPQHDIIDNSHVILLDQVRRALKQSKAAHFAVGYFFVSGFKALAQEMHHVDKVRLLIGNTTNKETLEQMVEGTSRLHEAQQRKRAERMGNSQRESAMTSTQQAAAGVLELAQQSDEEQNAALSLLQMMAEGRVEVRVYTKGRLHAKAYIFDFKDGDFHAGTAIMGSSNLSLSGLVHNTELNANLAGDANHAELTRWFNQLWDEAEDFNPALIETLQQSWVANDTITPYDIYLRTLYTLVKERLVDRDEARLLWETEMPPLAAYQEVAVEQTRRILKETNGVFVADVVGLGKSFIGLALLKHWNIQENAYGLVICPASLVPMWEAYIARYRIWAGVISMGMLSQKGNERLLLDDPKYSNAGIVLIDESHNFRNRDSQRYHTLETFTSDRPTVLMTATPRNTSVWDIYHQMKLWHPDDRTTLLSPPYPPNLAEFFRRVEPRNGEKPTANIRDLLDRILIRRTRRHVLTVYGESDARGRRFVRVDNIPKYFPDRELDTVSYNIEQTYGAQVYAALRDLMGQLRYARYNLYPFILPEHRNTGLYKNLQKASGNLKGLMRVMMFKRFESSVAAFRQTVSRLCHNHELFLKSLAEGFIPAGEEAQSLLYGTDRDDQVEFADIEEELRQASRDYNIEHFDSEALAAAILEDLGTLRHMVQLVEPIDAKLDDKLIVLQSMLKKGRNPHEANRQLPGSLPTGKVLIFTQFSDTANYLYDNLKDIVGEKLIRKVDSGTTDLLEVVARFAPQANPTIKTSGGDLRVLVATDVLSEGLNLQDGDHVINYDLHWNPVRLIQRVGRIDRLGSSHDCVRVYNFLPEAGVERQLGLQDRLSKRVQEIHDMIGEDAYILSSSERLNEEAMYAIYAKDTRILEAEEGENIPFSLLEAEEIIRQLQQDSPEQFARIQQIPNGVRSAQKSEGNGAIYVLCEALDRDGDVKYRRMYLLNQSGKFLTSDMHEILQQLKCGPNTPRELLPTQYNDLISRVQQEFEDEVISRQAELRHSHGRRGMGQQYIVQQLQIFYEKSRETETRQTVQMLTTLFLKAALPRRCHSELNALRGKQTKGKELVDQLKRIVRDYGITGIPKSALDSEENLVVRVVCSEALV